MCMHLDLSNPFWGIQFFIIGKDEQYMKCPVLYLCDPDFQHGFSRDAADPAPCQK